MIIAPTQPPAASTASNASDHRYRPTATARTLLLDSTQPAPNIPALGADLPEERTEAEPAIGDHDPSMMFAAAVISGALSPTPQTLEELFLRIGTSAIPDEFEARLKDLLA